ncbi:hypothetical protein KV205_08305 [Streptomyces sp. SKN60]|uniref:hypothetical protein n=1 Tax=Streptomyces sp. SKN60 TaxID=2855506 RepID=UPI0022480278|nr:hypothetical protein [Streptomyces sp. SKN60]MCX2180528.1 hypothetical protein [Streptomyces sp. SKN60]
MLHPPTETPSRDARPPRRPGVVVLPVAALAAVLALSVAVTARGGTADGHARATAATPAPAVPSNTSGMAVRPSDTASGASGQRPAARTGTPSTRPTRGARPTATPGADHARPGHPTATGTPAPTARATGTAGPRPRTTAARRAPAGPEPRPYDVLRVGDCFDIDRDAPGTVVPRDCHTAHDAELVARITLTGRYADDDAVRDAAAELCRAPLRAKAALQPLGTRWTTFVQYPYLTSYLLGETTVACSLAVPSGSERKLTAPLR